MSSRFHNKWHRHNHHTIPSGDPNYPDSGHDPIAHPDSPFQGTFALNGQLSASQAIYADVNFPQTLSVELSNKTTTGEFLKIRVDGEERLVRLWQYV